MRVVSAQVGKVAPLGAAAVLSGFVKRPVAGTVAIGVSGLVGDEQADLSVHGMADKAVYGYAVESYALWRESHPQHAALWQPGAVGENLTLEGLTEADVCIGDVMRVGSALLQVTQPREPCSKFSLRFGDPGMPKAMVRNGRSGWYYRVLEPGEVAAGDPVVPIGRHNPDWSVSRMNRAIYAKPHDREELLAMARLVGIAESWPRRVLRRVG